MIRKVARIAMCVFTKNSQGKKSGTIVITKIGNIEFIQYNQAYVQDFEPRANEMYFLGIHTGFEIKKEIVSSIW